MEQVKVDQGYRFLKNRLFFDKHVIKMISLEELMKIAVIEAEITTSRSGGPGGQHANKVETRIQLRWDIQGSILLTDIHKAILIDKLKEQMTAEGQLLINAKEHRSQFKNKTLALSKLKALLKRVYIKRKIRKPTRPTAESLAKNKQAKSNRSLVKSLRKKPELP